MVISGSLTLLNINLSDTRLLRTALCNIFYNPVGDTPKKYFALFLAIVQLMSYLTVFVMYFLLYRNSKACLKIHESAPKYTGHKGIIKQIMMITRSNILCSVPSATVYILSVCIEDIPTHILLHTIIYITPLNSLVNAIFIFIVNRKR